MYRIRDFIRSASYMSESIKRNWKLDLYRQHVIDQMPMKEYFQKVMKFPKHFDELTFDELKMVETHRENERKA